MKQRRLIRIEAVLSPKQAVLLWLRQEHQGKTSEEYVRWLLSKPPSFAPRPRVEKQVVDAIRAAMRGQEPTRIRQAVRQGQMQADFLILLVNRINAVILNDSQTRGLKIALLYERLRNIAICDESEATSEWATYLKAVAVDLLALQKASELIEDKYFDRESILLIDVLDDLQQQTSMMGKMVNAYDAIAVESGRPELVINGEAFQAAVNVRASQTAGYIVALAKSKMLDDFGEHEAADEVIRPYFMAGLNDLGSEPITT
jgi:hypothetical protein